MTAPLVRITLGAAHEQLIKVETGSACLQSPLGLSLPDVSHVFSTVQWVVGLVRFEIYVEIPATSGPEPDVYYLLKGIDGGQKGWCGRMPPIISDLPRIVRIFAHNFIENYGHTCCLCRIQWHDGFSPLAQLMVRPKWLLWHVADRAELARLFHATRRSHAPVTVTVAPPRTRPGPAASGASPCWAHTAT